jgi:hypothetical protein
LSVLLLVLVLSVLLLVLVKKKKTSTIYVNLIKIRSPHLLPIFYR